MFSTDDFRTKHVSRTATPRVADHLGAELPGPRRPKLTRQLALSLPCGREAGSLPLPRERGYACYSSFRCARDWRYDTWACRIPVEGRACSTLVSAWYL